MEYIHYLERRSTRRRFKPTHQEQSFHEEASGFLQRERNYALPQEQRRPTALTLRK